MRTSLLTFALVACTGGGGVDTASGTPDPGGVPSGANGAVFKGPFVKDSEVEYKMLDASGVETGEEGEVYLDNNLGDYELEMPSQGYFRIEAEGAFFDEATGGKQEVPIKMESYVKIEPGETANAQLNILTHMIGERMFDALQGGAEYDDAVVQIEEELFDTLEIGFGSNLESRHHETNPWGENYEQAYLFAVSSVIGRAAEDLRLAGDGNIDTLLDDIREDFREDGALEPDLLEVVKEGERSLDPDLAVISLEWLIAESGDDRPVPDPHEILDTDQDGIANELDNCRYVANADQAESGVGEWGAACDDRLSAIDTTSGVGCGVRENDGSLVCWDAYESDFGGTAPHPLVKPEGLVQPWPDEGGLSGSFVDVSVDRYNICAVETDGDLDCWSPVVGRVVMEGDFVRVEASRDHACGVDALGIATCFDIYGQVTLISPFPVADLALVGGDKLVVIDATAALQWLDIGTGLGEFTLPSGQFTEIESGGAALGEEAWACGLDYDGAVQCFGDNPLAAAPPAGEGFTELAVGSDLVCAQRPGQEVECTRDEAACPADQPTPGSFSSLNAEGCQICGIDDDGFGNCWPRRWYSERISYAYD